MDREEQADVARQHARLTEHVACLRAVHACASYVTLNVSSPNTKGLRDLQAEEALSALLEGTEVERDADHGVTREDRGTAVDRPLEDAQGDGGAHSQ